MYLCLGCAIEMQFKVSIISSNPCWRLFYNLCTFCRDINLKTVVCRLSCTYRHTCMFKLLLLILNSLFIHIFPWFEIILGTGNTLRYARMLLFKYSGYMHLCNILNLFICKIFDERLWTFYK